MSLAGCMALRLAGRGAPEGLRHELVVELGPTDLPARGAHATGGQLLTPVWLHIREPGWLHAWAYDLTDGGGRAVPRGALHHFKVLDPDHRELFSEVMRHVIASGEETIPVNLPNEVGYRLEAGDSLLVTGMLHNPTDADLRGVRLRVVLRYSPEGDWEAPLGVVPFFAHVAGDWESVSYDLPPGRSERSVDVTPAIDGRVLGFGGHLHRYGVSIVVRSLPDERTLWIGNADATVDGTVVGFPHERFVWSSGVQFRRDRAYRITAIYHNTTDTTIVDGGMGTLGGVIVPEEPWPQVDRNSPEYLWYLERELTTQSAHVHP
jgi:hypothetical protein